MTSQSLTHYIYVFISVLCHINLPSVNDTAELDSVYILTSQIPRFHIKIRSVKVVAVLEYLKLCCEISLKLWTYTYCTNSSVVESRDQMLNHTAAGSKMSWRFIFNKRNTLTKYRFFFLCLRTVYLAIPIASAPTARQIRFLCGDQIIFGPVCVFLTDIHCPVSTGGLWFRFPLRARYFLLSFPTFKNSPNLSGYKTNFFD